MPSSPNYKRDYKEEYDNYQGKPDQIKNRVLRNKAHRLLEEVMGGPIKQGMDVDHKKPLARGGTNAITNLRIRPESDNRSFRRNKDASMA
jgi:5-methylcytosine-specific restriction endonuclease McrA